MLQTKQPTDGSAGPVVQGGLFYHPTDGTVDLFAKVSTHNQKIHSTGAITGLTDLPGRVLEFDVVTLTRVIAIKQISFLTQVGQLDDLAGSAQISALDLKTATGPGGTIVTHRLTRTDFPILVHTDDSVSGSAEH
jgi:hypothetical protein